MRCLFPPCLALLLTASFPVAAVDTQYLQGLGDARYHQVSSDIVGRPYHIFVSVPAGYDDAGDTKFPTVYVLDGGSLFPLFAAYYRYLNFGEEIPDAIIIGISYGSDLLEEGNYRSTDYTAPSTERDYWGGAERFQDFLGNELLTFIEENYRSNPDRRIIFGQSIGGQFVLYTALTKPNLFWGHIASNPALHRNLPFFLEQHGQASTNDRSKLFVGSGMLDNQRFREPAQAWIKHWSGVDETPWDLKAMDLEGQTHMSAPPVSFRQGMRWLFSTH